MNEYEVRGRCVASYTVMVTAVDEDDALQQAKDKGCELPDLNELLDWEPIEAEFFQRAAE